LLTDFYALRSCSPRDSGEHIEKPAVLEADEHYWWALFTSVFCKLRVAAHPVLEEGADEPGDPYVVSILV